jgi:phage terminase large subunit-like protein
MPFDPERATRVCRFFEKVLRHPKERYAPFTLLPWEESYLRRIFGLVDGQGLRRIRRCYLEVPKKNGKSELAAGVALYMLAFDDEPAAEVYLAATTKEQAGIVFRTAAAMVEASPALGSILKVIRSTKRIVKRKDYNSFLAAISADGGAQDGINPHAVIIDELHRWKTGKSHELMNVLVKGTVARKQPLVFEITTAGSTQDESPLAWLEHERTRSIEAGDFEDPTFYGKVYAADPADDWTAPATWAKANPSLESNGGFLKLDAIEAEYRAAVNQPSLQAAFKRYHLGVWLSTETEWMPREVWRACGEKRYSLVERSCYLGLDLSERIDLTSLVLLFPTAEDDGPASYDVLPFFWMPKERIRERELGDRVPYSAWVEQGLIEATAGNVIDLRDIKKKIAWACEVFDVKEVAFDPHHALQLSIELTEELGLKCVGVPQRFTHMSEPTKKLMELALQHKLRHEGNKVLSWNINCLRVRSDGNDNVRPVKPDRFRSGKRIDGAIALILALSRAMFHRGSVYETRGLISV